MNIKKILSVVTSFFIFVNIVPFGTVSADSEISPLVWDGTIDTSWYDDEETEQHISTPSELAGLAVLVKEGRKMEGQTIVLDNDISLKEYQWNPIGDFKGVFDGNNHTIYGMNLIETFDPLSSNSYFGLFGLATKSTIQNLNLKDITINVEKKDSSFVIGGIAGYGGKVINCTVSGTIDCQNTTSFTCGYVSSTIGGIVGEANNIIRCKSDVNIVVSSLSESFNSVSIGGICGCISEVMNECCNYGNIIYTYNGEKPDVSIAGIVGVIFASSNLTSIKNSYNRADIECSAC